MFAIETVLVPELITECKFGVSIDISDKVSTKVMFLAI